MIKIENLEELVSVYDLPYIETPDDNIFGPLKLSIQIFKKANGKFYPKIIRRERVIVTPVYMIKKSSKKIKKMTADIFVDDNNFELNSTDMNSIEDALSLCLNEINKVFFNIY